MQFSLKTIAFGAAVAVFTVSLTGCSLFQRKVPSCEQLLEPTVVAKEKTHEVSVVMAPSSNFVNFEKLIESSGLQIQNQLGKAGSRLNVVLADGAPGLATSFDVDGTKFSVDITNQQEKAVEAPGDVLACVLGDARVSNTIATESEVDLIDGLRQATDSFDVKNPTSIKHIVVLANGLQTAGQYKMQSEGIPAISEINSVVNNLISARALPDLKGASVDFIGVGHVANPKEKLNQQSVESLVAFWTAVVEASNGHIGTIQREIPDSNPAKNSIPITSVKGLPEACISAVVTEDDGARFSPGTATFINAAAATSSAKKIAAQLAKKANCKGTLTVTGYVASATDKANYKFGNAGDATLSKARASAFASLLKAAGVSTPITIVGGGKGPYSDWDKSGKYVESLGKKNRIVSVTQ